MTRLDWHADRAALASLHSLDRAPESEGIDLVSVRRYRLERVRQQMRKYDIGALILSDPVNIRYATGSRNMQVFSMRNAPCRYLLLTEDKSILYEFAGCLHLGQGYETIDEVRTATTASFVAAGPDIGKKEIAWAQEMADTIRQFVTPGAKIGVERLNAGTAIALGQYGFPIVDAQQPVEMARAIKSQEEIKCIKAALRATEAAVARLREAIKPGITETQLWSEMHRSVIADNGDYCETRLLSSGARTNPWFQEAAHNIIEPETLVALDTDVVGCHGYYADFSRTFHSGPGAPTRAQKQLYQLSYEQVHYNMSVIKPGISFYDYAVRAWDIPEKYYANRYYLSAHGVGMTGEYPYLYHSGDFVESGYHGEILPGMTLCVESYIGEEGGREGVKLEQQLLVTETETELLSKFPFEEKLLL